MTTSYHSSQQNKETELTTVDSQNELNISSRRSSNEDEKEDIRRLNTEDIFPENIAAPNIEEDEKM